MAELLKKEYLESVLGWKDLRALEAQQTHPKAGVRQKLNFGIYAPHLSSPEQGLLDKMMAAIGINNYPVLKDKNSFSDYANILFFADHGSLDQSEFAEIKLWLFNTLKSYHVGTPQEINQRKKMAWDLLQTFKKEALRNE